MKYKTVEELQAIVDAYFYECDPHWIDQEYWDYPFIEEKEESLEPQGHGGALKRTRKRDYDAGMVLMTRKVLTAQQPYTMAGLALRLGMSRQGLMEYKAKDRFSDAIKRARSKVGEYNEIMLHQGKNAAGAIFNLKVNFGYHEKVEENPPPENQIIFVNQVPTSETDE